MSILIKGMDMPKTCDDCPLLDWDLSYIKCGVVNRKFNVYEEHFKESRAYDCPLIEIPPHGRLIDEKEAIKSTWMVLKGLGYYGLGNTGLTKTVKAVFKTAPAIIEAEKGE